MRPPAPQKPATGGGNRRADGASRRSISEQVHAPAAAQHAAL